jgi:hypothetical protein
MKQFEQLAAGGFLPASQRTKARIEEGEWEFSLDRLALNEGEQRTDVRATRFRACNNLVCLGRQRIELASEHRTQASRRGRLQKIAPVHEKVHARSQQPRHNLIKPPSEGNAAWAQIRF